MLSIISIEGGRYRNQSVLKKNYIRSTWGDSDRTASASYKFRPIVKQAIGIIAKRDGVSPVDVTETALMNNKEIKEVIHELQKATLNSNDQETNSIR
jgi:hypothetical protein